MDSDRVLAERASAGDERAFAELVERHREPLLRYVTRRYRADLAEDAVQEALLSAHRALVAGTVPADVRAWLTTIAWRRALDLVRREREALPLDPGVPGSAHHEPEARAIQANELGRVVAAISELPERQRTALRLSALEGRSLEEIGDALDVAPDAAKSLVARSRRTLSSRLAAAELGCDRVVLEMEAAAERGVRLSGELTLHVRGCRSCARAHRAMRRRRRVAMLVPLGLIVRTAGVRDKLRDLLAANPMWEAQFGAAKLCTAACLTAVSVGAATPVVAPVVMAPVHKATVTPETVALVHSKKKRKKHHAKPRPTATPVATPVFVATPVATPRAVATPSYAQAKARAQAKAEAEALRRARRQNAHMPTPIPTGGATDATTPTLRIASPTPVAPAGG